MSGLAGAYARSGGVPTCTVIRCLGARAAVCVGVPASPFFSASDPPEGIEPRGALHARGAVDVRVHGNTNA